MSIKIYFDYLYITCHICVFEVTLFPIGLKEEAEAPEEEEAKAKHQKEWEGSLKSDS